MHKQNTRFRHLLPSLPLRQILSVLTRFVWHAFKHRMNTIFAVFSIWRWGGIVGKRLNVSGRIRCHNYGKLFLGNHISLNSGPDRNYIGGDRRVSFWVGKGAQIIIEDNVGISGSTFVAFESITIRNGTFIGGGCDLYDNDLHPILNEDRQSRKGNIKSAPIEIGPSAFIGANSLILKGVKIGEGAVIGAGSLVVRNIPARQIWAGHPARFIRTILPDDSESKSFP